MARPSSAGPIRTGHRIRVESTLGRVGLRKRYTTSRATMTALIRSVDWFRRSRQCIRIDGRQNRRPAIGTCLNCRRKPTAVGPRPCCTCSRAQRALEHHGMDAAGNLYGTRPGTPGQNEDHNGMVFKLSLVDGSWTFTRLHKFCGLRWLGPVRRRHTRCGRQSLWGMYRGRANYQGTIWKLTP